MATVEGAGFFASETDLTLLSNVVTDPALLNGNITLKDGNGLLAVCKALAAHNTMEDKMHMSLMGRPLAPQSGMKPAGSRVIRAVVFDTGKSSIPNANTLTFLWCSKAPQALPSSKREQVADVAKRQEELDLRGFNHVLMGHGYVAQSAGCCFAHVDGNRNAIPVGVDGHILQLLWVAKDNLSEDVQIDDSLDGKFFLQPFSDAHSLNQKDIAAFKLKAFTPDADGFIKWFDTFKSTLNSEGRLKSTIAKLLKPSEVGQTCLWNISTCIPENNKKKYRESNVEIFMPDFSSIDNALSYKLPSVRNLEPRLDLYQWKMYGCVEPSHLEISDWYAQIMKTAEELAAKAAQARGVGDRGHFPAGKTLVFLGESLQI